MLLTIYLVSLAVCSMAVLYEIIIQKIMYTWKDILEATAAAVIPALNSLFAVMTIIEIVNSYLSRCEWVNKPAINGEKE